MSDENQRYSDRIRTYERLLGRLFAGGIITPMNTNYDRQELARFADWVRNEKLIPLQTCKYTACKTVGYRLTLAVISDYAKNRQSQMNVMRRLTHTNKIERAARAAARFYELMELPVPDLINEKIRSRRQNEVPMEKIEGNAPAE